MDFEYIHQSLSWFSHSPSTQPCFYFSVMCIWINLWIYIKSEMCKWKKTYICFPQSDSFHLLWCSLVLSIFLQGYNVILLTGELNSVTYNVWYFIFKWYVYHFENSIQWVLTNHIHLLFQFFADPPCLPNMQFSFFKTQFMFPVYSWGWGLPWSIINLPEATPLKQNKVKFDIAFPGSYLMSVFSHLGGRNYMLTSLPLYLLEFGQVSCICHNCSGFIC